MAVATRGAMLRLPKEAVLVQQIRSELLIKNGVYWKALAATGEAPQGVPKTFKCWEEDEETITVPRHYKVPWKGKPLPIMVRRSKFDDTKSGRLGILFSKFKPRAHQPPAIEALSKPGDKIIAVKCGGGKTIITMAAWALHRKGPLLILVDTQELAKQWIAAAELVCRIKPEEIGSLKGPVEDWKDKAVVIGFVQTMWRREYSKELYDYFDVVAYDEVHICGAVKMQLTLPKFSGERWGLSATPERADGNSKLIYLHMGNVEYEDLEQDLKPTVYFVQLPFKAPPWMLRSHFSHVKSMIASALAKNLARNQAIMDLIDKAASTGREVLVIGDRVKQLVWWAEHSEYKEETGLLVAAIPDPLKKDKKISLTSEERSAALKQRVVFATPGLARKGLDKAALDTLILPIPTGDENTVQQMFGRIQRPKEAGKAPFVVVIEDAVKCMVKACDSIREYCAKHDIQYKIVGKKHNLEDLKAGRQMAASLKNRFKFRRRK